MEQGKLYISETGVVVMYTGRILGTVFSGVIVGSTKELFENQIGGYSNEWLVENFKEYNGEIILKNK